MIGGSGSLQQSTTGLSHGGFGSGEAAGQPVHEGGYPYPYPSTASSG